jgi:hypothetical protein
MNKENELLVEQTPAGEGSRIDVAYDRQKGGAQHAKGSLRQVIAVLRCHFLRQPRYLVADGENNLKASGVISRNTPEPA